MTPAVRTQPTHVAVRERGMWVVVLPDGTRVQSPSQVVVRQRVHDMAGSAVRFPEVTR